MFNLADSKHRNIIRKAISDMRLNCERNLTLGEVADYVGCSHTHFSKVFKRLAGVTPDRYRKQGRRIDKGRERDSGEA